MSEYILVKSVYTDMDMYIDRFDGKPIKEFINEYDFYNFCDDSKDIISFWKNNYKIH